MAADDARELRANGALLVGSPDEVVDKSLRHAAALGGVSRLSFQMNAASLSERLRSILPTVCRTHKLKAGSLPSVVTIAAPLGPQSALKD